MVPEEEDQVERTNVARAYNAGNSEGKGYVRNQPYCNKCKLHHARPCTVKCLNSKKIGHMVRDYKNQTGTNHRRAPVGNQRALGGNQRAPGGNQRENVTCYECGRQGHFRSDYPKLKNQNHGTFLLNNRYASMLFDSGADRSFVPTTFSSLMDVVPTTLDNDLMPIELASFDAIVGIDWLARYYEVIMCDKKIVRIPYGNEVLTIYRDRSEGASNSRLSIISYTKTQKYVQRGCHVFLAQITEKRTKDKSNEKRLEDVPTVRNFMEVFPNDFPGLFPT
ncbi:putative reverse transcriptase domain-containing protein [Tanacetum coccineum]